MSASKSQIQLLLDHCPVAECPTCSEIVCPYGDRLHFHHDGCPSCYSPVPAKALGESANRGLEMRCELIPCPRCGAHADVVSGGSHIRCANIYNCDCETRLGREAWNRRDDKRLIEAIELLEMCLGCDLIYDANIGVPEHGTVRERVIEFMGRYIVALESTRAGT